MNNQSDYLAALASLERRAECGSFFGQSPKNEPHSFFYERSEHLAIT
ncbi:MAG: hypothetical protein U5L45_26860 [Saprospiraceae bacterium]|nr:hypothetical protein [Saprospiraceae bacterium]